MSEFTIGWPIIFLFLNVVFIGIIGFVLVMIWSLYNDNRRKRKNDEVSLRNIGGDYDFDPYAKPKRYIVETRAGESMTALEDPETGRLILED